MPKHARYFGVIRLLFLAVCACALAGGLSARAQDDPDPFPRTVTDAAGRSVTIPAHPEQVAVVGEVPAWALLARRDRLAAVRLDAARVGQQDALVGVDLLLTTPLHAAAYPALLAAAEAAHVPVFQIGLIASLDEWRATVRLLGRATGRDGAAADVLRQFERQYDAISRKVGARQPVRMLALTPEGYTYGVGTLITDLVQAAGGVNVAAEAGYADFRQVDDEALRALAPEVLLLAGEWANGARSDFLAQTAYRAVPAVRTGRVIPVRLKLTQPDDPGAVLVRLAWLLHPAAMVRWW